MGALLRIAGLGLALATVPGCESLAPGAAPEPRIAVVGAGATGLTTAYLLGRRGYRDVTVFEASERVGGVARTETVEGQVWDLSTMFVPGASIAGDGVEPLLAEMIEVSGERLVPGVDFDTLHLPERRPDPLPALLAGTPPDAIAEQLLGGLGLMARYAACLEADVGCSACGVCSATHPGESIRAWGTRQGVPAFAALLTTATDGLGAGPSAGVPAAGALAGGRHWTPGEAVRVLRHLGVGSGDLPPDTPGEVAALLAANAGRGARRWWSFERGFEAFWESLCRHAPIRVRRSAAVVSLAARTPGPGWLVGTQRGREAFDVVIVATPPRAALRFLPEGPRRELLAGARAAVPPNDVFLARTAGFARSGLPPVGAWWPTGLGLGTRALADPQVGGPVKPVFWLKRHPGELVVVGAYTLWPTLTREQVFDEVRWFARKQLGFEVTEWLAHERYHFPALPADPQAWWTGWAALQGADGLYFAGEAFSGSGVPAIAEAARELVARHFPER